MTDRVRVLIIDDRIGVRQTLRNILFGYDCEFVEAATGEKAIAILNNQTFDITFLDLSLSDISGFEVLERSRGKGEAMGKVIVLTGLPEESIRTRAVSLGAVAYLSKDPIDRARIRQLFQEAMSAARLPSLPPADYRTPIAAAPVMRKSRRTARGSRKTATTRQKILVLDDKEYWLETIERLLGDEFEVVRSSTAAEAYAKVRTGEFALVVIDMKLAGTENGLDVLSRMRRARSDLRAIILAENPDWTEAVESGKRGAIDYVSKDDPTVLKSVITRVLRESRAARVFLSYDRRDQARVLQLYQRLMTRGFITWIDVKSLIPGQRFELQIEEAIKRCDHFVFCVSHYSIEKEGLLRRELRLALDIERGKRRGSNFVIPVRLEDCEYDAELSEFQTVDLFQRDGVAKLMEALSAKQT
jgi:DNA-binding NtrC family response regulator